ncbi:cation transport protein [Secundilactobacillus pentosiphilus]|uniref:Cation transport protein n=1 Tax=Secundilactobacillus pentosiphilus TaxID=1714682 RepID=A0A1Z5IY49_9LACO|nr:SLC13 family permease [Secundilactobacillus pentosiphilus]GAX06677.1 cation transport protein [Secundilactobacillus pentosiphilus]
MEKTGLRHAEVQVHQIQWKNAIGWFISILLPALIAFVPTSHTFSHNLKVFLVITVFMIVIIALELLPKLVSGIMMPMLYMISGIVSPQVAFGSWTSATVWMVCGGLIFSNVLDDIGLLRRIAYYVIKKSGGTYAGVTFGCFFIGVALNVVTFSNGWLVASAVIYGICKAMDLKPSKESSLICFAGTIGATGCCICLYDPGYFAIIETAMNSVRPGFKVSLLTGFIYNGAFVIWCILSLLILLKVYKTKDLKFNDRKGVFDEKYQQLGKLSTTEKKGVLLTVLLLAYLSIAMFVRLPVVYGFIVVPILMFMPGIRVGKMSVLKRLDFPLLFFVASCLGIGLVGAHVGFGAFLTNLIVPILAGKSMLFICLVFLLIGTLAHFCMTPYAMLGGLALPFAQIAISLNINPLVACMCLLYSCELLFLPYQSAGNLIMYGYGMMTMKDFFKEMALKFGIMVAGFVLVMFPLWNLFGLLR